MLTVCLPPSSNSIELSIDIPLTCDRVLHSRSCGYNSRFRAGSDIVVNKCTYSSDVSCYVGCVYITSLERPAVIEGIVVVDWNQDKRRIAVLNPFDAVDI